MIDLSSYRRECRDGEEESDYNSDKEHLLMASMGLLRKFFERWGRGDGKSEG